MNIQTAFPSKYLKAADLGTARPVVTIRNVTIEEVGDDRLPVLTMEGKDKALILNRTNANMIEEIAGTSETDRWRGVRIQLFATKTDFGGKRVDCIRVERPTAAPTISAAPSTSTMDQWSASTATATTTTPRPFVEPVTGHELTSDDIPF